MAVPSKSFTIIPDSDIDPDSPITTGLMTDVRDNDIHLEEWLGKDYTAAQNHDHDGANSKPITIPSASVGQGQLKTSTGSVSQVGGVDSGIKTLPGGEYGFYPRIKMSAAASLQWVAEITGMVDNATPSIWKAFTGWTSYVTTISLYAGNSGSWTIYAEQRYVTASGPDHWIFVLRDKNEDRVISVWESPDHPCYGQGGDESEIIHPFVNYWTDGLPSNLEIILVDNEKLDELKGKRARNKSMAEVVHEEYEIDTASSPSYSKRSIVELDQFDLDKDGNPKLKSRDVESLPEVVKFRKLKLK